MTTAKRQSSVTAKPETVSRDPQYVAVQARGTIALPAGLRRRLHLDEPGAQVAIVEREDGVIELRPALPVPADQRWFWTDRWQAMEREVDAHIAAGRVVVLNGPDALFDHLDAAAGIVEAAQLDPVAASDPAAR